MSKLRTPSDGLTIPLLNTELSELYYTFKHRLTHTCTLQNIIYYSCILQVEEKLAQLKREYDEKLAQKEELKSKAELLELQLDRAAKLVSGLAGERVRWEESVKVCA